MLEYQTCFKIQHGYAISEKMKQKAKYYSKISILLEIRCNVSYLANCINPCYNGKNCKMEQTDLIPKYFPKSLLSNGM